MSDALGRQDTALATLPPSIDVRARDEIWLAWADNAAGEARRWSGAHWEKIPPPAAETWDPIIRASAGRDIWMAWRASSGSIGKIFVSRWDGSAWHPAGQPLSISRKPFTHAGYASMILDSSGLPIVAWQEESGGPRSLHAARWDGNRWSLLGGAVSRGSDLYSLQPQLALGADGQPWLAWNGGTQQHAYIRVARWDGKAWHLTGRIGSGQAYATVRDASEPRLRVLSDGTVLLAWLERDPIRFQTALALARWTGAGWQPVPSPAPVRNGEQPRTVLSLALGGDSSALLAWSEIDASDAASVYVQRLSASGWQPVVTGLYFNPIPEYAQSLAIASGSDADLYLAWDEPDAHEARTRVVHIYPCAGGETPVALAPRRPRSDYWPKTVDEAVERIVSQMDAKTKALVRDTPRAELAQFHIGWGTGIRNSFGLWKRNASLLQSCGSKAMHPEECSMIIIQHVWDRLQERPAD